MANKAISTLAVGSSVYLNVGGVRKEFLVVHQGKPSSLYDASCDGTWLLMKDCYEMRQWNSNSELLYENSSIHSYLNSTFLNLFDANIRDAIKQVKIPYLKGGKGGSVQSGANGLSCKVFLLSGYELNFRNIFPADGAGLDGFAESITNNSAYLATYNGTLTKWWLRSISTLQYSDAAGLVSGYSYNSDSVTKSYGIRPCIILPSNTLVDDSGNVVPVDLTAHKTLVNGTVYTVKGGKCMVNGTIYNILKGRTLIDGTAWDIAFPEPLVMPVKGDLITMNLDGTDRLYRVLKIVDGTTVEVLGMWDYNTEVFGNNNTYSGNAIDDILNGAWYTSLTSEAKNAIVPKTITQDSWYWGTPGSPRYSGTYGTTAPGSSSYNISKRSDNYAAIGSRYVYAMSIQEVLDYLSDNSVLVDTSGMLRNQNIWKMFWNQTSNKSEYIWLRSALGNTSSSAWYVYGIDGRVSYGSVSYAHAVRGALQIDLSKIDFTIGGA